MKNNKLIYLFIIIIAIWCLVLSFGQKDNKQDINNEVINQVNVTGFSTDFTRIVEDNKDSIVTINCDGKLSSGFVYKQEENNVYILCSYHGVADANNYAVSFSSGYKTNAELVGTNIYLDLAVLKIDTPYEIKALEFGDEELLKAGEFVICIGTPKTIDFEQSVEMGMVSNNIKSIENNVSVNDENIIYFIDLIQLSANIKNGYSGSPVLNMNGEVIGMITMSYNDEINFATTAHEIKIVADNIINGIEYKKYQLGISGSYVKQMPLFERSNLNLSVDTISGLYINKIKESSILYLAGLRQGDIISKINSVEINNRIDYLNVVYTNADSFEIEYIRNNEIQTVKVDIND